MPRRPKKSLFPTQQTFPCPVQGCRTQVRSRWGFTQHVRANHHGMDLQYGQYPENEGELVQFPSSDGNSESPPPSPNAFLQFEEPDLRFSESDWRPSDLDLGGNAEPIPLDSQAS